MNIYTKFTKFAAAAVVGLTLSVASMTAQALPIGLGLVIDGSGSISGANFTTQKNGYIAALNNVLPADGSVAVGVYQFSSAAQTEFSFQVINNATDLANLVAAINGMTQLGGATAIGDGINLAASQMAAFGYANLEKAVIDVSTDGGNNTGANPSTAASNFVTAALATASTEGNVNCLGIGGSANCGFIAGPNSFSVNATFATLQTTLEGKIEQELGILPEPGMIAIFALGFAGLIATRRRVAA